LDIASHSAANLRNFSERAIEGFLFPSQRWKPDTTMWPRGDARSHNCVKLMAATRSRSCSAPASAGVSWPGWAATGGRRDGRGGLGEDCGRQKDRPLTKLFPSRMIILESGGAAVFPRQSSVDRSSWRPLGAGFRGGGRRRSPSASPKYGASTARPAPGVVWHELGNGGVAQFPLGLPKLVEEFKVVWIRLVSYRRHRPPHSFGR
jgi:hypothetical protein